VAASRITNTANALQEKSNGPRIMLATNIPLFHSDRGASQLTVPAVASTSAVNCKELTL
jgi:hypothetical protein